MPEGLASNGSFSNGSLPVIRCIMEAFTFLRIGADLRRLCVVPLVEAGMFSKTQMKQARLSTKLPCRLAVPPSTLSCGRARRYPRGGHQHEPDLHCLLDSVLEAGAWLRRRAPKRMRQENAPNAPRLEEKIRAGHFRRGLLLFYFFCAC